MWVGIAEKVFKVKRSNDKVIARPNALLWLRDIHWLTGICTDIWMRWRHDDVASTLTCLCFASFLLLVILSMVVSATAVNCVEKLVSNWPVISDFYYRYHNADMVVLSVHNSLVSAIVCDIVLELVLLDLSIWHFQHHILLSVLKHRFSIQTLLLPGYPIFQTFLSFKTYAGQKNS